MDIWDGGAELAGDMPNYSRSFQSAGSARWEDWLDHGSSSLGNNGVEGLSMYNLPRTGSLSGGSLSGSPTTDELYLPDDGSLASSFSGLAISKGYLPYDHSRGHGSETQVGHACSLQLQNGFCISTDEYLPNSGCLEDFDALNFDLLAGQRPRIGICETHGGYAISNQVRSAPTMPKHLDVAAGFDMIRNDEHPHFLVHQETLGRRRTLRLASENWIPSRNPEEHNSLVNYLYSDERKACKAQQVTSMIHLLDEQKRRLSSRNELPYQDGLYSLSGLGFSWSNAPDTNIPSICIDKPNSQDLIEHFSSLNISEKNVYLLAKDQEGCRHLQRKISEGRSKDIEKILLEVTDHLVELAMDPFGNYLVQKLFDACDEDQRTRMLHIITRSHRDLLHISCDIHGTRVAQKIIETIEAPEQLSILVSSLKPNILTLMKNANGTHVAQHCLRFLPHEYMEILFETVASNCVELATDRHGCCVLQKCITHLSGGQRFHLTRAIAMNSRILSQDEFGNYAVQYVLDKSEDRATEDILRRLEGHFVDLSMQKYSSNVVESCLKLAEEDRRAYIIQELIESPRLDQILQDPYGNYVIQSTITTSKGALRSAIVKAIKPYVPTLLANPYGKKVLSNKCLKNIKWHLV